MEEIPCRILNEPEPPLLTAQDVAGIIRVPERTLANWRSARTGPRFIKVGGHVRYRRSDIDAWLASRSIQTEAN